MSDTTQPPSGVSEEQAREYAAQLRSAPAEQIVTEVLSVLLNAAQVKLGRRDARLMIDLSASMIENVRAHVSADLAKQVDHALGQLRLAQVQAENAADQSKAEPNDLATIPSPPSGGTDQPTTPASPYPPPPAQPSSAQAAASRLWIPGRDF